MVQRPSMSFFSISSHSPDCLALSDKNTGKTPVQLKLEQLRLALEWNRVDIAERHMKNERNWEVSYACGQVNLLEFGSKCSVSI